MSSRTSILLRRTLRSRQTPERRCASTLARPAYRSTAPVQADLCRRRESKRMRRSVRASVLESVQTDVAANFDATDDGRGDFGSVQTICMKEIPHR